MSICFHTEEERLVAEQAIAAYREAQKAMAAAPHGQGLAVTEAAVLRQGRAVTQTMMEPLISTHAEVQKGGPVAGDAGVGETRRSSTTRAKS